MYLFFDILLHSLLFFRFVIVGRLKGPNVDLVAANAPMHDVVHV